ncbi:MAG: hypothetical protein C0412_01960 [Flavobacterium sp.]|jgi:hypothetical protein|nr:hypothetical protein [Flavobacterium sp.]
MTKVYHYIYFRTYDVISKTNKIIPEISSAQLLSISILLNIFTIYFLLGSPFGKTGFYIFLSIGIISSFLNLKYFMNDNRRKSIISDFQTLKMPIFFKYLVDIYPWLSILLILISTNTNYNTIFIFIGVLIVLRLMQFFYEM